jgi:hypothetical protein
VRSRPLRPARPPWRSRGAWLTLAVVLGTVGVVVATNPRWHTCDGLTWQQPETWRNGDGDCIGVTDGATELNPAFDNALSGRFKTLFDAIYAENDRIARGVTECRDGGADDAVEVAALAPWRNDLTGGRAFHELEGMYVAQWQANNLRDPGGCHPYIKLLVADPGSGVTKQGLPNPAEEMRSAQAVVKNLLAHHPRLVAVIGLALSRTPMIAAAHDLAAAHVPVVADLVTADGFDRSNFSNIPTPCAEKVDRSRSLGDFYRLTFANGKYLDRMSGYLRESGQLKPGQAIQVTQYGYDQDPFACTNVQHVKQLVTPPRDPIAFELSSRGSDAIGPLTTKVTPICGNGSAIRTVFYTARALDLANFIIALGNACPSGITVAGPTDSTRLLTPEIDGAADQQRLAALKVLAEGKVKLFYPASTTPARVAASPGYAQLQHAFHGAFNGNPLFPLDAAELADTWIVNAHDAFYVTAAAIHALDGNEQPHTPGHVAENLSAFQITGAAQGTISFDDNGTRVAKTGEPVVIRLCVTAAGPEIREKPSCAA